MKLRSLIFVVAEEIVLDHPGGLSIITNVLRSGIKMAQQTGKTLKWGSILLALENTLCKECRWPLQVEKEKGEMISLPAPIKGIWFCDILSSGGRRHFWVFTSKMLLL